MKKIVKWFKNLRFQKKIMITCIIVGIIPMIVVGVYTYSQVRSILMKQERENMKDYISQAVLSAETQIHIYDNLSEYVSYNDSIAQVVTYHYNNYYEMYEQYTKVLDPMLSSVKYFNDGVGQLTIYSDNKDTTKHDTTLAPLADIENTDWYQKIKSNNSQKIQWIVDEKDKKVFSARNMPTIEECGQHGVLFISVDYQKLFESFDKMNSHNSEICIVDESGEVIYDNNQFTVGSLYARLNSSTLMNEKGKVDGYTVVTKKMSPNWTVWYYKPDVEISHSVFSIVVAIILVVACCVLISLTASNLISRWLVREIDHLADSMKRVEKGDLNVMVDSDAQDEVGDLVRGFNKMLIQINALIDKVYKGEIVQRESEMRALQAQINPHFLYNSLSLINWKAIENDQQDISKLTLLLSTFYRTALNRGKNILSIRDEVRNMQSYLEIQQIMHDYEFDVEINFDDDIMECKTLNLILQPLVENAIDHGIDVTEGKKGIITICGTSEGKDIIMTVSDNGAGMEPDIVESILTAESKGYGVRNVNERIMLYYGAAYHLKVESTIGEGTKITIRIPKLYM